MDTGSAKSEQAEVEQQNDAQLLAAQLADQSATWSGAAEILAAFDRLDNPHAQKKRDTIIALVDARLAGRSEETVWRLPQCCSRNTYHSKWKQEPAFAHALELATQTARGWKDGEAMRALSESARRLALASPLAVTKLIERLGSVDETIIVRAAVAILDRAGTETAGKASADVDMTVHHATQAAIDKIYGDDDEDGDPDN